MNADDPEEFDAALRDALGHDPDRTPPEARIDAIRRLAGEHARPAAIDNVTSISTAPTSRVSSRRQLLLGAVAAGTGLIVGAAATMAVSGNSDSDAVDEAALAAREEIAFSQSGAGQTATISQSALINHTWGGELVLDIADLPPDQSYDVIYTDLAGETLPGGSFRSVPDVLMRCRFNTAMLRADTARIDIATGSGEVIASATLV